MNSKKAFVFVTALCSSQAGFAEELRSGPFLDLSIADAVELIGDLILEFEEHSCNFDNSTNDANEVDEECVSHDGGISPVALSAGYRYQANQHLWLDTKLGYIRNQVEFTDNNGRRIREKLWAPQMSIFANAQVTDYLYLGAGAVRQFSNKLDRGNAVDGDRRIGSATGFGLRLGTNGMYVEYTRIPLEAGDQKTYDDSVAFNFRLQAF